MPWKSSRFWRNTVVLTRRSSPVPASSRIARRFASTCSVCSSIVPPESSLSPGFSASWPDTNTKPFAAIAWEYGAPWNGAGAASVRTTVLSATLSSFVAAGLREGDAQRLEDRFEHVLRIGSVQEAHVQGDAGSLGEALEEPARDVGAEAADARLGQIDVRDEERLAGHLEHDARERLRRRHRRKAVMASPVAAERLGERAPEPAAGLRHLELGGTRLDLEG